MLEAAKSFSNHQILIAGAPNISLEFYKSIAGSSKIQVIQNDTYNLLNNSDLAMVTSGTATLETALFKVPEVVCYKGSSISYQIAKRLIKVKYISLVNLIMDQLVVTELIQNDLTPKNIIHELKLLEDSNSPARQKLKGTYTELEKKLGGGGASDHVAKLILNFSKQEKS